MNCDCIRKISWNSRNARIQSPSVWPHLIRLFSNVVVGGFDGEWRSLAHEKSMRAVGITPEVGEVAEVLG